MEKTLGSPTNWWLQIECDLFSILAQVCLYKNRSRTVITQGGHNISTLGSALSTPLHNPGARWHFPLLDVGFLLCQDSSLRPPQFFFHTHHSLSVVVHFLIHIFVIYMNLCSDAISPEDIICFMYYGHLNKTQNLTLLFQSSLWALTTDGLPDHTLL